MLVFASFWVVEEAHAWQQHGRDFLQKGPGTTTMCTELPVCPLTKNLASADCSGHDVALEVKSLSIFCEISVDRYKIQMQKGSFVPKLHYARLSLLERNRARRHHEYLKQCCLSLQ